MEDEIIEVAPKIPLEIIFQDEYVVVINKPNGLMVHRSPISMSNADTFAIQELRDQLGVFVYPAHASAERTTAAIAEHQAARDACVMIIDDEKLNIEVVKAYLKEAGIGGQLREHPSRPAAGLDHVNLLRSLPRPLSQEVSQPLLLERFGGSDIRVPLHYLFLIGLRTILPDDLIVFLPCLQVYLHRKILLTRSRSACRESHRRHVPPAVMGSAARTVFSI